MIIGVPKEIKTEEYRVALTPEGVGVLTKAGHRVIIERSAGVGSGFSDQAYRNAGAHIVTKANYIWNAAMVVKVKEPQEREFDLLRSEQILFTYLHLAAAGRLTEVLSSKYVTAIDYATVQLLDDSLPLLKPMSEITGRLTLQIAARYLEKAHGGRGILLGGTTGVPPGHMVVLGGGVVGYHAALMALSVGTRVTILDNNPKKLVTLRKSFNAFKELFTANIFSEQRLEALLPRTDVLIGAVLVPGARAPKLVTKKQVKLMRPGSVIIDVAVDQGGCIETTHPTTHKDPVYTRFGVTHYCVANIPGIVPRTSTKALTSTTLPYILELANKGYNKAIAENPALARGVNVHDGKIIHPALR